MKPSKEIEEKVLAFLQTKTTEIRKMGDTVLANFMIGAEIQGILDYLDEEWGKKNHD